MTYFLKSVSLGAALLFGLCAPAFGQSAQVAFGGLRHDSQLPVEITSERLSVDQTAATAEFTGEVLAGQGTLRIQADTLLVEYQTENDNLTGQIERMTARGNVTLTNGAEAAEGQEAIYVVADGKVRMTGDVLLTQGLNAISGEILNIDLDTGNAVFEGRIRTVLQPKAN